VPSPGLRLYPLYRWCLLANRGWRWKAHSCPETSGDPYYFSIVTYTTLGFGDVRPATLAGEIIVSSEVILGYTTLGLLLSVLAQIIARRS